MTQVYARPPAGREGASPGEYTFLRSQRTAAHDARSASLKPLTQQDVEFLSRMDGDAQSRRRTQYINELKKHPLFKPHMLEPPKPKFKTVSLEGGPIIKVHEQSKTGLEKKKPYKWGPLGGYY